MSWKSRWGSAKQGKFSRGQGIDNAEQYSLDPYVCLHICALWAKYGQPFANDAS